MKAFQWLNLRKDKVKLCFFMKITRIMKIFTKIKSEVGSFEAYQRDMLLKGYREKKNLPDRSNLAKNYSAEIKKRPEPTKCQTNKNPTPILKSCLVKSKNKKPWSQMLRQKNFTTGFLRLNSNNLRNRELYKWIHLIGKVDKGYDLVNWYFCTECIW